VAHLQLTKKWKNRVYNVVKSEIKMIESRLKIVIYHVSAEKTGLSKKKSHWNFFSKKFEKKMFKFFQPR